MTVLVWLSEGLWPAAVDAARRHVRPDTPITLLHVTDDQAVTAAHRAYTGLLGRGRPDRDPAHSIEAVAENAARDLLESAAARLGRPVGGGGHAGAEPSAGAARSESSRPAGPVELVEQTGPVKHVVTAAAEGAELLICVRDGEPGRPGPKSLGPDARFVVDHVRCPVLLVWPEAAPDEDHPRS